MPKDEQKHWAFRVGKPQTNRRKDGLGDAENARPVKQHNSHHPGWCHMLAYINLNTIRMHACVCACLAKLAG